MSTVVTLLCIYKYQACATMTPYLFDSTRLLHNNACKGLQLRRKHGLLLEEVGQLCFVASYIMIILGNVVLNPKNSSQYVST